MKCEGQGDGAQPVASDADQDDRARLIGEIVAEFIASLGPDRAMTETCVVTFGTVGQPAKPTVPSARGEGARGIHAGMTPANSASEHPHMAREHFAQRGM